MNYQEQINKLKNRLDGVNNTLGNIKAEIDKLETETKQGQGKWIPKVGEKYWAVDLWGKIFPTSNESDELDKYFFATNIPFKTQAEAEEYKAYQLAIAEAKYEFSEEEWKNENIEKWALIIDPLLETIDTDNWLNHKPFGIICFKTEKIAEQFANKWYKEILKYGI